MYPSSNPINAGGILIGYSAIGWNDASETDKNLTWSPQWGTTHGLGSVGNLGGDPIFGYTADYSADLIPGYDNITVTNISLGAPNQSCIRIIANQLHHIELTPMYTYPASNPVNAGGTIVGYRAIGWNDEAETEKNLTWTPEWGTTHGLGSVGNFNGNPNIG